MMHGITQKKLALIERTMRDIKINIERMDLLALTEKLMSMRKILLTIRGDINILKNLPLTDPLAIKFLEYKNFPIDDTLKIINQMKLLIEVKYPTETIYGLPIDSEAEKQKDLAEWFAILKIYIDKLVEVGKVEE